MKIQKSWQRSHENSKNLANLQDTILIFKMQTCPTHQWTSAIWIGKHNIIYISTKGKIKKEERENGRKKKNLLGTNIIKYVPDIYWKWYTILMNVIRTKWMIRYAMFMGR